MPIGDLPPRDPCDHRRDVHREERGGRSQLGVPRRPHRGDDVGEERREHDDVAGGDTEQAAHPEPGEDRPERSGDPLGRRPRLTGHDEREPEPGHRDRGRRDEERELRAAERVQGGIRERGDRASERHRHLPHAERPATSRRRVGREERSCACDRARRPSRRRRGRSRRRGWRSSARTQRSRARPCRAPFPPGSRVANRPGRRGFRPRRVRARIRARPRRARRRARRGSCRSRSGAPGRSRQARRRRARRRPVRRTHS